MLHCREFCFECVSVAMKMKKLLCVLQPDLLWYPETIFLVCYVKMLMLIICNFHVSSSLEDDICCLSFNLKIFD